MMDIYEYWYDYTFSKRAWVPIACAPSTASPFGYSCSELTPENIERTHIINANQAFQTYLTDSGINPVALGFAPIAR